MSRGGLIGGPVSLASNRGRWTVEDTRAKTNLGVGVEEYLVVNGKGDPYFYAFPSYQQIDFGFEVANTDLAILGPQPMSFSDDGQYLASVDFYAYEYANIWNMWTGRRLVSNMSVNPARGKFIPGTDVFMVAGNNTTYARKISMSTGARSDMTINSSNATPTALAFSPDGSRMAVGWANYPWFRIFNTATGALVFDTPGWATATIYSIAWSPDGSKLAIGGNITGYLKIYTDTTRWSAYVTPSSGPVAMVYSLSWSPDGTKLAAGAGKNGFSALTIFTAPLWSRSTPSVTPKTEYAYGVAFSPSGKWLAVAGAQANYSSEGALCVYRTSDWAALGVPTRLPIKGSASAVCWWNPGLRKSS